MMIDAHTHYGVCYEARDGLDPARWLGVLDECGVDGALVAGHRSMCAEPDIPAANDALAKFVAAAPARLLALGTVHPFSGRAALAEAERCLKVHHMRGLKLHPWLQGFPSLAGKEVHDLCDFAGEARMPVMFHDGTPNVSMPSQVAMLAEAHPQTTFVLGHGGLIHLWRQAADAAALCGNMYIILCGPHLAALRHICKSVPAARLLWGSDHGFGFTSCIAYRKSLMDLVGLTREDYAAVMGGNAARLFDWRPASLPKRTESNP